MQCRVPREGPGIKNENESEKRQDYPTGFAVQYSGGGGAQSYSKKETEDDDDDEKKKGTSRRKSSKLLPYMGVLLRLPLVYFFK